MAVGSISCVPARRWPFTSTMTMSSVPTSLHNNPRGFSRKRPEPSGSSALKWLHTPSDRP